MKTVRRDVEVTLRGLRTIPNAPGEAAVLYGWQQVAALPGNLPRWGAWGNEGNRVLEGDRVLTLSTGDPRGARLAERAQKRAFRNAWRSGQLEILETQPSRPVEQKATLLVLFVLCLVMGVCTAAALTRLEGRILGGAFWGALALLPVLEERNWRRLRGHIQRVRLDCRGLGLLLTDGSEVLYQWAEVIPRRAYSPAGRVYLPGIGKVSLHGFSSRLFRAVFTIAGELSETHRKREKERMAHPRLNLSWLFIMAALFAAAGWVLIRMILPDEPAQAYKVAGVMLALGMLMPVIFNVLFWFGSPQRLRLRSRRRRMRAAARATDGAGAAAR